MTRSESSEYEVFVVSVDEYSSEDFQFVDEYENKSNQYVEDRNKSPDESDEEERIRVKTNKFLFQDYNRLSLRVVYSIMRGGYLNQNYPDATKKWLKMVMRVEVDSILQIYPQFLKEEILKKYKRRELFLAKKTHEILGIPFNLLGYMKYKDYIKPEHDLEVNWSHFMETKGLVLTSKPISHYLSI